MKHLKAVLVLVAMLSLFGIAGLVGLQYIKLPSASARPTSFVGDWQCASPALDIHIELQGQLLLVKNLEKDLWFEPTTNPNEYREQAGTRQLRWNFGKVELQQADGSILTLAVRK